MVVTQPQPAALSILPAAPVASDKSSLPTSVPVRSPPVRAGGNSARPQHDWLARPRVGTSGPQGGGGRPAREVGRSGPARRPTRARSPADTGERKRAAPPEDGAPEAGSAGPGTGSGRQGGGGERGGEVPGWAAVRSRRALGTLPAPPPRRALRVRPPLPGARAAASRPEV